MLTHPRRRLSAWYPLALAALMASQGTPSPAAPDAPEAGWWPKQKPATGYVEVAWPSSQAEQFLLVSLSGLAAQGVNAGRIDEMVWIRHRGSAMERWKDETVKRLKMQQRGTMTVWELLERYRQNGLVAGYVPFQMDSSKESGPKHPSNASTNAATYLAATHRGVLAHPDLVERLKQLGLVQVADPKAIPASEEHPVNSSTKLLAMQDPAKAHLRDLLIAQQVWVGFGIGADTIEALKAAPPLTPVLGWNGENEATHTGLVSAYGDMNVASDWTLNLPFLMAAGSQGITRPLAALDPKRIDEHDTRPVVSFLMSDGDNLCFLLSHFWAGQGAPRESCQYWDNPQHGRFPMGFSACLGDLVDAAPVIVDQLAQTKPPETSVVQFGGGYFYPDRFAANVPDREGLLRRQARLISQQMQRTGATILCFIVEQSDSPQAQQAMAIYAQEISPLLGMMVMDYAPYHRKEGSCYWFKDAQGRSVPALTARYCLWAGMKNPLAGDPNTLAAIIEAEAKGTPPAKVSPPSKFNWVAVHAWSQFSTDKQGLSGLNAVAQCVDQLDAKAVHVVSPEEMFWRLRRDHETAASK